MSNTTFWWDKDKLYVPRFVFGTTLKFMPTVPFVRMYELFYRYLRRSRVCVIVGYSFMDDHVNGMIRDAFNRYLSRYSAPLNLVTLNMHARDFSNLGMTDNKRIWQFIGPASKSLRDPRFTQLVTDLALKGDSSVPHEIIA